MELTELEFEVLEHAAEVYNNFLVFTLNARQSTDAERELARIRSSALASAILKVKREHVNP
jgi:hypothetical protein